MSGDINSQILDLAAPPGGYINRYYQSSNDDMRLSEWSEVSEDSDPFVTATLATGPRGFEQISSEPVVVPTKLSRGMRQNDIGAEIPETLKLARLQHGIAIAFFQMAAEQKPMLSIPNNRLGRRPKPLIKFVPAPRGRITRRSTMNTTYEFVSLM